MLLTEKVVRPGISPKDLTFKVTKLGREGKWEPALQVLDQARDAGLLDLVLCNAAVTACARSQAWQASLALLETMSQGRLSPLPDRITMNSALNACATAAHWQKALHLLDELQAGRRGLLPNTVSFNTVLNACARSEQWQEALFLLFTMEENSRGVRPDLFSFNTAMAACEGGGRWQTCVALLEASQQRGLQPDIVSYNTILSSARGEWQRALLFAEDLFSGSGPRANVVSLGAAFAACEQSGQWQVALSLMQRAQSLRLDPRGALQGLLGCMKVARRWEEALQIQLELQAWDSLSFSFVLGVMERSCCWQVALNSIWPDMNQRSIRPDSHAYSALLGACTAWAKTAQVEAAEFGARLLQRAKDHGKANDVIVEAMLCLLEQSELWAEALNLLGKERRRPPNLIHFATVASACAKGQRWETCLELLRQLNEDSAAPDMVLRSTAISACERSFQWQDALAILAGMIQDSMIPDSVAYSSAMLACNKADRWDLSLKLFEQAVRPDYKPDDAISVLSAGLGAYAASRDWHQALKMFLEIQALMPRAEAKHWLQDAQSTAMFAALQPSAWEQCLALLPGEAELTAVGCAVRACGMGRNWQGALQLFAAERNIPIKAEKRALWSATHLACQAADTPQPLSPELRQLALPL